MAPAWEPALHETHEAAGRIYPCHPQEAGLKTQRDTRLFQHPDEFLKLLNRNQLYPGEPLSSYRLDRLPRCSPGGVEHPVPIPVSPSP